MSPKKVLSQTKNGSPETVCVTPKEKCAQKVVGALSSATETRLIGRTAVFKEAVAYHVESFNWLLDRGLKAIVEGLAPCIVEPNSPNEPILTIALKQLSLEPPQNAYARDAKELEISSGDDEMRRLPSHCRLAHTTYGGELTGTFMIRIGDSRDRNEIDVELGQVPVMVCTKACHLHGMSPEQLMRCKEDETEVGGYFILNGLERVIRMLLLPRANYPMAVIRPSFKGRGKLYTEYAMLMRCMRPDNSTLTNTLHYCLDGSVFLRFSYSKEEWLIPFVLACKCVYDLSDGLLLDLLSGGAGGSARNVFLQERVIVMLQQQNAKQPIASQNHAHTLMGSTFRPVLGATSPKSFTDEQVGLLIAHRFFMVHTDDGWEKLQTLIIMYQKLIALVRGEIEPDNQDAFSSQEVLLPGQMVGLVLKEALEVYLLKVRGTIAKMTRKDAKGKSKYSTESFKEVQQLKSVMQGAADIGQRLRNFLSTGNVSSRSGLDLMQVSGFTVVADKLNAARFSSHFVSVHRGQYFAEMKTTTVRKLLPETWGFLCPVHTPDGSPCGLLNHMAHSCRAVVGFPSNDAVSQIVGLLASLGAESTDGSSDRLGGEAGVVFAAGAGVSRAWIMIDGRPIGHIPFDKLEAAANTLRAYKVVGKRGVPTNLEIVCITHSWKHIYPGLFLFLGPSRLVRPVRDVKTGLVEWIGPLEQLFLNVAAVNNERLLADAYLNGKYVDDLIPEVAPLQYTHQELRPTEMFSVLAALTPFSNHNQSPRNMYQCQMLKQTMGTPYHNHSYRTDNKVYKIMAPQKPIVRTEMYESADMDTHPQGTNAIVAVITYTGQDLEDAMVINRASYERGFGHGTVYKVKIIDAATKGLTREQQLKCTFSNVSINGTTTTRHCSKTDAGGRLLLNDDGLPSIGTYLQQGDPMYCIVRYDGKVEIGEYKDEEPAYVENVTRINWSCQPKDANRASGLKISMKLRVTRNPIVGDKFSSRHGQKGIMSILWPAEDMPFSESGITPDILFNPHGFPSRMTIGMLIESIAAKTAALEGRPTADATTFRSYKGTYSEGDNEADPFLQSDEVAGGVLDELAEGPIAAEYFGRALKKHGFQRLGTERMYSGVHGTEIETEIFLGVVYYQRLRHMVGDKAQVRARGPVDKLTMQPIKGRKRHGGIRFGEMERDSLLAHGTSFLLHDRLMRCSDYDIGWICPRCGSVITPQANAHLLSGDPNRAVGKSIRAGQAWTCPPCSKESGEVVRCNPMPVPWVFRYLACEVASMNIRIKLRLVDRGRQASLST